MNYNAVSYVVKYKDRFEAFNCNGDIIYERHGYYTYDEKGRLNHCTMVDGDFVYHEEIRKYDDDNKVIYRETGNVSNDLYTYDDKGNLSSIITKYKDGSVDKVIYFKNGGYMEVHDNLDFVVYEYDENNKVSRFRHNSTETIYTYDEDGEVVKFDVFNTDTKELLRTFTYNRRIKHETRL